MEQRGSGQRRFGARTRLIITVLGVGFAILIVRLFYLQVVQADMWKEKASSQQMYSTSITANRGNIYDRNMKTLAKSVTVWTVFISPAEMEEDQRELVASGLSEILGYSKFSGKINRFQPNLLAFNFSMNGIIPSSVGATSAQSAAISALGSS